MRKVIITSCVVFALIGAADANALLIAKPQCGTMKCRAVSQLKNLKHAKYVCHQGRHYAKRWSCAAVKWLTREYNRTMAVLHPRMAVPPHFNAWLCIHRYEGAWNAHTGNGYYGGLQMDISFMRHYGAGLLERKGTADRWTPLEQMWVAEAALNAGRGFYPWPQTAHWCGLI